MVQVREEEKGGGFVLLDRLCGSEEEEETIQKTKRKQKNYLDEQAEAEIP
jgi:hypothetical protein